MDAFRRFGLAAIAVAVVAAPAAQAQVAPFEIPVITSLTGPAAPVGATEGQMAGVLESFINRTAGSRAGR